MSSTKDDIPAASPVALEPAAADVKRYQRLKLTASVVAFLFSLTVLIVGVLLSRRVDAAVRTIIDDNDWLRLTAIGFVYAAVLESLTLPLSFWSGFVLEHRYGLSTQTLPGWFKRKVKEYLVGGFIGLVGLLGLYALLWYSGGWWWAWAAAGWLLLSLILGQLLPVVILPLFYKITPLEDPLLRERLERLTEGTGLTIEGVYRLNLSVETRKANAALAGLGRTRRVLLGDTLLQEFTPDEIEVVFAHEVGHHVHRHLLKMLVFGVFLVTGGFWLVDLVLRQSAGCLGFLSFTDPALLPLVLLVMVLYGLVLSPLEKAISRHFERQADTFSLHHTGKREAFCSAFVKLARLNKADPEPHSLVVWLFHDHPPIRQRLALARGQ